MKILCKLFGHKIVWREFEYVKKHDVGTKITAKNGMYFAGSDKSLVGSKMFMCKRCGYWGIEK